MSSSLAAAVVSSQQIRGIDKKPIVPDHKVFFVPTDSAGEAYFLCGMLNSEPVKTFVDGFTVKIQVGALFRHLKLPEYDNQNEDHVKMAELSSRAHKQGLTAVLIGRIDQTAWAIMKLL